ncbi:MULTISPECIES: hypothetical protein [unclassified Pseudomonas]|uniref:hypothetical protein n=1 Tax=unclassified Pseudomonas TaxID=196821 RepID=UPI00244A1475|nr:MULTISPECIES: hypothetical protein [unclassified Pseudomonas]MDG9925471.1 hypothetical protein [Pseudomonas sp. GD04045]MDH0034088.1 hypothetical protein [Pseudomonas sp. GD04019]
MSTTPLLRRRPKHLEAGGRYYDWKNVCDICQRTRSAGSHAACSKKRKALKTQQEVV